jgi:hypothetical protein
LRARSLSQSDAISRSLSLARPQTHGSGREWRQRSSSNAPGGDQAVVDGISRAVLLCAGTLTRVAHVLLLCCYCVANVLLKAVLLCAAQAL